MLMPWWVCLFVRMSCRKKEGKKEQKQQNKPRHEPRGVGLIMQWVLRANVDTCVLHGSQMEWDFLLMERTFDLMELCVFGTCWTSCLWEIVSISCAGKLLFHCFCILDNFCVTSLSVTSDGNAKLLIRTVCKHLIEFYILVKKSYWKSENKSHTLRNKTTPHISPISQQISLNLL